MISITYFFTVMFTFFVAEMGDKTQLMLFALTSKYKIRDIVIGTAAAVLVINGLSVCAGGLLNEFLKSHLWIVKLIATIAFFYFSLTSLVKGDDEEEGGESKISFAALAVFCIFFIAELGDKTQLSAITFGATNGLNPGLLMIWVASSIGFFAADMIGLVLAFVLHGKTPDAFFKWLAFGVFAVFGFINLYIVLTSLELHSLLVPIMAATAVVFVAACVVILLRNKKAVIAQDDGVKEE
ncbi:MAG: TMEM165/GDT1 family protein [Treponema sp.]|nr:TMEM165/GDT1 family protein [Treponema sp.]